MTGNRENRPSIVGAWRLIECSELLADGSKRLPLGADALGQIIYTPDGRMSAQLVRAGRPAFPSDDYRSAETELAAAAFQQYFGYFGSYRIEAEAGTVTHEIEGAWLPNLDGKRQVRTFRFEGDCLILEAQTPWGTIRNVWGR